MSGTHPANPTPESLQADVEALAAEAPGLAARPAAQLAAALGQVGARFLVREDPLRQAALQALPDDAGISPAMAERIIDGMARDWTAQRLEALLRLEFPDPGVLDGFVDPPAGGGAPMGGGVRRARLRAQGDRVALHICAGSVPGVSTTSLVRSLLVKSPVLLKPGRGDRVLPSLFLEGLEAADPHLARAVRVRYWAGGDPPLEEAVLDRVDRVVVYGSDETVGRIRHRTPVATPVVAYHHRISAAFVGPEALEAPQLERVCRDLARAASTFDQRGCVSPHRVWVQGSPPRIRELAEALAKAMEEERRVVPPGPTDPSLAARVHQVRGTAELRGGAAGRDAGGGGVWSGPGVSWTVVEEGARDPLPPGVGLRTLAVRPLPRNLPDGAADGRGRESQGGRGRSSDGDLPGSRYGPLVQALAGVRSHLQTAGIAGFGRDEPAVADALARAGFTRICPLEEVAFPPAWWHHDGAGPLRRLIRWVEWVR